MIVLCRTLVSAAAVLALPLVGLSAASAAPAASKVIAMVDTDSDGTVDLKEVQAVAGATFDKLEKDADGTLDKKELKGRISKAAMKSADPDSDGTLDKKEYLGLTESLFLAADPDKDGTLDAKEMKSKAGKALTALLK